MEEYTETQRKILEVGKKEFLAKDFTAVFETVVHDMNRERAMSYIEELATFFNCGWDGLLRLK